jgi:Flp pilus assembly CpaE family ATPase
VLVNLISAKGSPGVTTTALCLAAARHPDPALVVEADPSGGDLECWYGPRRESGLIGLATTLGPRVASDGLERHTTQLVRGVRALTAPTTSRSATATLAAAGDALGATLARYEGLVLVDRGRWWISRETEVVAGSDLVVVVCRPALASVEHSRELLEQARQVNSRLRLVVVGGTHPYGPDEIAAAVGVPVVGVLPWDPEGVSTLIDDGAATAWRRTALADAAARLVRELMEATEEATA